MSKLDDAFFKAYRQTDEPPMPKTLGQSRPIPLSEALGLASAEACWQTPARPAGVPVETLGLAIAMPSAAPTPPAEQPSGPEHVNLEYRPAAPPAVDDPSPGDEARGVATLPMSPSGPGIFRPMLQVDAFAWPEVLAAAASQAKTDLDAVAAALVEPNGRRRSVVAVAAATAGAGATTLLLGAAARLAARGLSVVMIDGDQAAPALSSRLGLAPSLGWEDVVAGRQPLEEVLIESIEDRLTLLPLCNPDELGRAADARSAASTMVSAIATLRKNYDLVLVDLGVADSRGGGILDGAIDAAIVVHDARRETADEARRAADELATRGIACAGAIDNFVPPTVAVSYRRAA